MRKFVISLAVAGILISVAAVAYMVGTGRDPAAERRAVASPSPTAAFPSAGNQTPLPLNSPTATPNSSPGSQGSLPGTVSADWETYQGNSFSVQYPPQFEQSTQQGSVVFSYLGPTQRQGTEVYDGVSVRIDAGAYQAASLREYVTQQRQQVADEPATNSVTQITSVNVAGLSGLEYTVNSLGEFRHVYLPAGDGEYLRIVTMVADPENGGYQQAVTAMLNSLTIQD